MTAVLPDDWLQRQIARLNVVDGDVATLSGRLPFRTFTYAAHRPGWAARLPTGRARPAPARGSAFRRAARAPDAAFHRSGATAVLLRHLREDRYSCEVALEDSGWRRWDSGEHDRQASTGFDSRPIRALPGTAMSLRRTLCGQRRSGAGRRIPVRAHAIMGREDCGHPSLSEHG